MTVRIPLSKCGRLRTVVKVWNPVIWLVMLLTGLASPVLQAGIQSKGRHATSGAQSADLELRSDVGDVIRIGGYVFLHMSLTNYGPDAAQSVILESVLPPGIEFESLQTAGTAVCVRPAVGSSGIVRCTLTQLISNGVTSLGVTARSRADAVAGAVVTFVSNVTATTVDPDSSNNSTTMQRLVQSGVERADLSASIPTPTYVAGVGSLATFRVVLRNDGPDTAAMARAYFAYPRTAFDARVDAPPGWTCHPADEPIIIPPLITAIACENFRFDPGSATFSFSLTLPVFPDPLVVSAGLQSVTVDPNTANNEASATAIFGAPPAIAVPAVRPTMLGVLALVMMFGGAGLLRRRT